MEIMYAKSNRGFSTVAWPVAWIAMWRKVYSEFRY